MKEFICKMLSGNLDSTYFTAPFSGFGWREALDIFCIALLFFLLYLFMRDRRAGKLVAGVVMILAIYFVSSALHISAVRYLFGNFLGYGVIMILIVFQPEIRAAMERMGSISFRGLKTIGVESKDLTVAPATINAIVEAAKDMSFTKTGALIVIERSTKIGEYIRTGTQLNADLTPELLRAIFYDKAPLHDGAVIIRGGRIFAAGCYLPLSDKEDISKGLGTRHRAAIGLSEQSDAVIVVVSEETGTISIAYRGELFREFTSVSLRRELLELLAKHEPENAAKGEGN